MALIADISVPEMTSGKVAIVAAHLENKCAPACRCRQMDALLAKVKGDKSGGSQYNQEDQHTNIST